jgi:hypothetical protein
MLSEEQVAQLEWATLEGQILAQRDMMVFGHCYAKVVEVDGDVRLIRISPSRVSSHLAGGKIA